MIRLFAFAAVVILTMLPRTGNPDAGSLGGRVTDENRKAIAGATVSATNVFSRDVEVVRSDAGGSYRFAELHQGRYSVFTKAEGHGCVWVFNVIVNRGQHTQLDLTLRSSPQKDSIVDTTEEVSCKQ